jgi:hypothetical protein
MTGSTETFFRKISQEIHKIYDLYIQKTHGFCNVMGGAGSLASCDLPSPKSGVAIADESLVQTRWTTCQQNTPKP